MTAPAFSMQVLGLEDVASRISSLPEACKDEILTDVGEYGLTIIRQYAPQNYVSRAQAYPDAPAGPGWFSDKQRKFVMAGLRDGTLSSPYRRTGGLAASWSFERSGTAGFWASDYPAAPFVMGFAAQSRHEKLVGWKKITDWLGQLSFRSSKYREVVMGAVQKAMRKVKLG